MAQVWNWTWLAVAFLVELASLAALAAEGWSTSGSTEIRLLLAVLLPLGAAVVWGLFAAPRAPVRMAPLTAAVTVAVPGAAALALADLHHVRLAVALVVAAASAALFATPPEREEA
jgi:hypothetical protein